jgi:phenylpropionate dioxygenase-like ring-hydroxylating dioxygenase large terminal subunit
MDTPESIANLRQRMAWEHDRSSPPPHFPALPPLPPGRYTSPEFFALEREHLWSKVWLYAGHVSQLPEPGSWLRLDLPGAPVAVVRGRDDVIRAFYNVCSHRGAPLVRASSGTSRYFRCTYHQWTYDVDGQLLAVMDERDFPEPFDKACLGLQEVRCEQWGSWIFVNEDPACAPLLDWLGMLVDEFEQFGIEQLRPAAMKSYEVECNWKLTMDAFLEVYHIKGIHPKTVGSALDHRGAVMGLLPNGHTRMTCPVTAPSSSASSGMPAIPSGEIAANYHVSHNVFPNIITPTGATARQFLMFWPLSLTRTRIDVVHFGLDWGERERPAAWESFLRFWDVIMDEDLQFLEWQQQAVLSRGFKGYRLSYMERRIYYAHESIDRTIGVERIPEHLRAVPMLAAHQEHPEDQAADPLWRLEPEVARA